MRRLILLLILPLLACSGSDSPPLSTPTLRPPTETAAPPTAIPTTPVPTEIPPTVPPPTQPGVTTFPDPNAYTWQEIASGFERPVDLQQDGTGRLYIVEKLGHIHLFQDAEDGDVSETP
ncbi:MAG TPA: hypothetical protein VJM08_04055, partial [Anaerolineales bacterium]|nr:hypothetical protein [Anaerolineales bacterium]